jgi:hypothetical protein
MFFLLHLSFLQHQAFESPRAFNISPPSLICFVSSFLLWHQSFHHFLLLAFTLYLQWFHMALKALENTIDVCVHMRCCGWTTSDWHFEFKSCWLWFSWCDHFCANCICFFIQHFNSSKFGIWCFLSMACTWSVKI